MFLYKRFIEMLQNNADKVYDETSIIKGLIERSSPHLRKHRVIKNTILSLTKETTIIINESHDHDGMTEHVQRTLDNDISPPFRTCWIQLPINECLQGKDGSGIETKVFGIFIHEVSPYYFLFSLLTDDPSNSGFDRIRSGYMNTQNIEDIGSNWVYQVIQGFLYPFAKAHSIGTTKTNDRIKYKLNGEKTLHKIRKIVHIFPKGAKLRKEAEAKYQIDWSHQWAVRGHWRAISGIGKDRNDEYCVEGFTWVLEHVKGPDDKPFVKKTRVVDKSFFKKV